MRGVKSLRIDGVHPASVLTDFPSVRLSLWNLPKPCDAHNGLGLCRVGIPDLFDLLGDRFGVLAGLVGLQGDGDMS